MSENYVLDHHELTLLDDGFVTAVDREVFGTDARGDVVYLTLGQVLLVAATVNLQHSNRTGDVPKSRSCHCPAVTVAKGSGKFINNTVRIAKY